MILCYFFIILFPIFFVLDSSFLNFSETSEKVVFATQRLHPIDGKNMSISDCLTQTSILFTIFHCKNHSILMVNSEILRPAELAVKFYINISVAFVELCEDSALLISDDNLFYLIYRNKKNEKSFYYFSFRVKSLANQKIQTISYIQDHGFHRASLLYKNANDSKLNILAFSINMENGSFRENNFPLNFEGDTSIKLRLNNFMGNMEIIVWSKEKQKFLIYTCEKYEFKYILSREIEFSYGVKSIQLKFSNDGSKILSLFERENSRVLLVYKKNDFFNNFTQICELSLENMEKSKEENLSFGFLDDHFAKSKANIYKFLKIDYLILSFYERRLMYFYKLEEYDNSYGRVFCDKLEKSLDFGDEKYSDYLNLGKHFSFLKMRKIHEQPLLFYLEQDLIDFDEFIILSHENAINPNFLMVPFCQEKEEFINNQCLKCPSYSFGFQSQCYSCQKYSPPKTWESVENLGSFKKSFCNLEFCKNDLENPSNHCISCSKIMNKFDIPAPKGSHWEHNLTQLKISPFPCQAVCELPEQRYFAEIGGCINNSLYLKLSNKCHSITDFFNCSASLFCYWEHTASLCMESGINLPASLQNLSKSPFLSFCSFELSLSQGAGTLRFKAGNKTVQLNHFCLINLKHTNGVGILEYYYFGLEILKGFVDDEDHHNILMEFCATQTLQEECNLRTVFIDLSKGQKQVLAEKSVNMFVKITFLKSLNVDFSKINLSFQYKWVNFVVNWYLKPPYFGIISFILFFIFLWCVKKILVCISYQLRVNICNVLAEDPRGKRIRRLIRNNFIKRIRFFGGIIEYDQKECPFCLENFSDNEALFLINCKHVFHEKCFVVWIDHNIENLKCPICRRNLKRIERDDETTVSLEMSSVISH